MADPQRVLRALSSVASTHETNESVSGLFQKTFSRSDTSHSAKLLASDLVHYGALHDPDWETVIQNLKEGLSSDDPDAMISALQLLTSIPAQHLIHLILKDDLGDFVAVCLEDSNPGLRAGAVTVLGHLLVHLEIIKGLSNYPEKAKAYGDYWNQICNSLVDASDEVSGSAFRAVRSLMQRSQALRQTGMTAPWSVLFLKWNALCSRSIHLNLAAVLHRANELDNTGIVVAVDVLYFVAREVLKEGVGMESGQQKMLWALPSIGGFLEAHLMSVDLAVAYQSAVSLLQLCKACGQEMHQSWGVFSSVSLGAWSSKAIGVLENLAESKDMVPARGDILLCITKHLDQLEIAEIGEVSKKLLQSIGGLPRSVDRTRCLMHLWRAVLCCDLKVRRIRVSRGDALPGVSLQSILESPFFTGVVAGHQKQNVDYQLSRVIAKASYPAYKQELVSTLMEVMMEHSQKYDTNAVFPPMHAPAAAAPTPAPPTRDMSLETAIQSDIQTDVIDWFAASVVALYLTQACLGWDNVVADGYYGLTLPADLWLQQLQITCQTLYTILMHHGVMSLSQLRAVNEEATKSRKGKVLKMLSGEAFEIQKLMKRMVFFWSFLNPALRPRVFWVVCHHIELPDAVNDIWTALMDSLKDLLITRPTELTKIRQEAEIEASRQGRLAPINDSVYSAKSSEDSKASVAFNQAEVSLEGMTVGLVCFTKLAKALVSQYQFPEFPTYYRKMCAVVGMLRKLCAQVMEEGVLTVDMFDQCQSVQKQLDFILENPPEGAQTTESQAENASGDQQASEQAVTYLPIDISTADFEGFPFSVSKSLTLTNNKRTRRHKALRINLARGAKDGAECQGKEDEKQIVPPVTEKPTAVDLAAAVGGLNLKEDESDWKILTGQGDPIQLSIRHQVDAFKRMLGVEISAENKMGSSDITGVIVSFAIEGPVAADREGLIVWHPEKLPAQEAAVHRLELSLIEFGAIEIQPFMDVALHGSQEEMPALSCSAYTIPLAHLLIPASMPPSAKVYFQEVASWPESLNTTAVCRWPGTNGAMQLLSAFQQSHLKKIWPDKTNTLGVLQAVYLLETFHGVWISLSITGQLVDLRRMGLAAWTAPSEISLPGNTGFYICKCTFASTSPQAIASVRAQTAELLTDLSCGGLVLGLDPGVGQPPPAPPIHPSIASSLPHPHSASPLPDMQKLALEEWKRLNCCP